MCAPAVIVSCTGRQWLRPRTASCLRNSHEHCVHNRKSGSARHATSEPAQAKANILILEDVPAELSNGDPSHISADTIHEDGSTPMWQAVRDSWSSSECSHRCATCYQGCPLRPRWCL